MDGQSEKTESHAFELDKKEHSFQIGLKLFSGSIENRQVEATEHHIHLNETGLERA
jgi:hypothetical protein